MSFRDPVRRMGKELKTRHTRENSLKVKGAKSFLRIRRKMNKFSKSKRDYNSVTSLTGKFMKKKH
jgi:hypothetical protein